MSGGPKLLSRLNRENSHSNLNIFKEAKAEINKIYTDVVDFMKDSNTFVEGLGGYGEMFKILINKDEYEKISGYLEKVDSIRNIIGRNAMKCAFFGRTSNGKSTTINAILGAKILPSGLGHTTSCFLGIQGTAENQGYIVVSTPSDDINGEVNAPAPKPIDSISELASDLSSKKVSGNTLIHIYWPQSKCKLLSEDVVFIDSPGIDVECDIDQCIDYCCLDADVFVYVANGESTINLSEKKFFYKVRDKLSIPNIFILNNRWDASANEEPDTAEQARNQHMEKYINFLTKELKVCSKAEAEKRIFFVSSKEALINRTKHNANNNNQGDSSLPTTPSGSVAGLREGWQNRFFEFTNFENHLERVLSETATKTKFASHSSQCFEIIDEVKGIMENLFEHSQEQKTHALNLTNRIKKDIDRLTAQQKEAHSASMLEISKLSDRLAERVAQSLRDELKRLEITIDEFSEVPFVEGGLSNGDGSGYSEGSYVRYKTALGIYIQKRLEINLSKTCASDLSDKVYTVAKNIVSKYASVVKDAESQKRIRHLINSFEYIPEFHVDCRNFHSDFRENLSFRFSLGPTTLFYKLFSPSISTNENSQNSTNSNMLLNTPLLTTARLTSSYLPKMTGKIALGGALVGLVLLRNVPWRFLGGLLGLYGSLYMYEYSCWRSLSKEGLFKAQFAKYLSGKIQLTMDNTSRHSALQPQYALKTTLKTANIEVDGQVNNLKENMNQFEIDSKNLDTVVTTSKSLRNKAIFLEDSVKKFEEKYLD